MTVIRLPGDLWPPLLSRARKENEIVASRLGVAFVLVLSLVGCGSSGNGSDGGSGGTTGNAGQEGTATGGTTGSGGSAGGGGACGDIPPCLAGLVAAGCSPSGACVETISVGPPAAVNICYANGVKWVLGQGPTGAAGSTGISTVTVTKSGGGLCLTESITKDVATGTSTATIMDASGNVVATEIEPATGNPTITCGGKSYTIANSGSCSMPTGTGTTCTQGTCQ